VEELIGISPRETTMTEQMGNNHVDERQRELPACLLATGALMWQARVPIFEIMAANALLVMAIIYPI